MDRSLAERIITVADKSRTPLVAELREIETKISELRNSVMKEATVLGATCTKSYLAVKEIGQVDTVIIDEASMVLLPMAWFVAGLAKDRKTSSVIDFVCPTTSLIACRWLAFPIRYV